MRKILLICTLLLSSKIASAQRNTTFVKLPGNLGYVIDSTENSQKQLITFLPAKQFHSGALIQLPDSSIVFRIILSENKMMRNLNFSKETANDFLKKLTNKIAIEDSLPIGDENTLIKEIADSTSTIKYIQFEDLVEMKYVSQNQFEISSNDSIVPSTFVAIEGGFGVGQVKTGVSGVSSGVKMTIIQKYNTYGIRYCGTRNPSLFSGPDEYSHDVSILAGVHYLNDNIYLSVMSGLSYVTHQFRDAFINPYSLFKVDYETIKFRSIGIPIDFQIDFFPHSRVGLDFQFFGNINNYTYWGGLFSIRIGKLLPPKKKH